MTDSLPYSPYLALPRRSEEEARREAATCKRCGGRGFLTYRSRHNPDQLVERRCHVCNPSPPEDS